MELLTKQEIQYFKTHKNEITYELLETLRKSKEGKLQTLEILDLEKDNDNYYLDAYQNRISYNGLRHLKKAFTKLKLSKIHIEEIEKCSNDILYFLRNYVRMTTPKGFNFVDFRDYQEEFLRVLNNDKFENLVIKYPRQAGKSTTTAVKLAQLFCFSKDLNIGIVAYDGESAREFLDKTKKILATLPIWLQSGVTVWNKGSIECENNIKILTDTPSEDSFRGYSMNVLVIDECAYLDSKNWWSFTESILPSQAGLAFKKNIILSTPKGKNHFYDIWKDAGETLETSKNGYVRCEVDWKKVPRFKSDGTLYDNDEFMKEQIKRSGLVFFNSAYKCEFIGSSMTLIAGEILSKYKIKEPVDIDSFKENKILIYEEPIKEHRYVMGVDTAKSEGLSADFTGIQVFDMTDLNFKQVLSAHLKIDYALLPEIINEYGLKYNQALVIIENNEGSGQVVNDILKRDYEYENLYYEVKNGKRLKYPGFRTTKLSRDIILQTVKMLAESNKLELCDELTIKEFETFIQNDNGKFQAQFGCNDDLVMSVCLCFSIFCQCKNFEDFKEIVESLKTGDSISNNYLSFGSFEDGVNEDLNQNEFLGLDLGRYN